MGVGGYEGFRAAIVWGWGPGWAFCSPPSSCRVGSVFRLPSSQGAKAPPLKCELCKPTNDSRDQFDLLNTAFPHQFSKRTKRYWKDPSLVSYGHLDAAAPGVSP